MIIYNYNETKAVFIPRDSSVSVECRLTHKFPHSCGMIKPSPAYVSIMINNIILYGKSLIHDENDPDHTNMGNFYTEDEEKQEIEKAKLVTKAIIKKLQDGNYATDEYYITEDCNLRNYLDK